MNKRRCTAMLMTAAAVVAGCSDQEPGLYPVPASPASSDTTSVLPVVTTTTTAAETIPTVEEVTTTTTATEPILCPRYNHPLHHLTCEAADERSAARKTPAQAAPARTTVPAIASAAAPTPQRSGSSQLASIRACESGGDYSTNTGNGYYGAYQFDLLTWESVGGSGNPANASPGEQDQRAAILQSQRGNSPWPTCG